MAKKVAGWGVFIKKGTQARATKTVRNTTRYVDRVANKCYRSKPKVVAALTAEASA